MSALAMITALAAAACFAFVAPRAARLLPPRLATWVISGGAVVSAACAMAALAMAAVVVVGQVPLLAREGEWSGSALHHHAFTEPGVGVAALVCVLAAAVSVVLTALRHGRSLLAAYRLSRSLSPTAGALVVLSGGPTDAVAVPGRPGRVVMGDSLRAALSADERRALVAHEQAHLEHGHHWHRVAVHLAAAANPLLAPLRSAIVHATERWADEEAAKRLGDRRLVAATLARVALLSKRHVPAAGMAFAAHAVPLRAAALLAPPTRPRPLVTAALVAIPLAAMAAALLLMQQTDHLFDLAQRIYQAHS